MLNPSPINLCNFTITDNTIAAGSVSDVTKNLDGMLALSVLLIFAYGGSGGGTGKAYVQTSLDQGSTWIDIACVTFAVTGKSVVLNFSGLTPRTAAYAPTDGSLADDTAVDGILGDRVRVKLKTIGAAYGVNTLLTGRAIPR